MRRCFSATSVPTPSPIELLVAKLEALEVPTPPVPDVLTPGESARLAACERDRVALRRPVRTREEAFPALVLRALKQARYDPRNLGVSGLTVRGLPLHVADSPLPGRDLPRGAHAGGRALGRPRPARLARAGRVVLGARAGGRPGRVRRRRDLPRLAPRAAAVRHPGWDACFDGEITGAIGSGLFVASTRSSRATCPSAGFPATTSTRSGRRWSEGGRTTVPPR